MKWLLTITFLFLLLSASSQESPALLAKELTASSKNDLEKVTAIFNWITANISYRVKPTNNPVIIGPASLKNYQNEMDEGPLKPLNERVAENVLQKRTAVCDGYARLFTTLCDFAGIRSEIIIGYAKSATNKPTTRFGVNHIWNAVMIESKWYLLDATWASGYVSKQGGRFIREYDEKYFLSPPGIFIQDHYPDDARWTLLPDSAVPDEFYHSPFKQKSFNKYHITTFYPATGVIDAFIGDTIRLKLEIAISEKERNVSPDLLVDSALFSHSSSWLFLKPGIPENKTLQNENNYIFTVTSPDVEWLYLMYNNDMVLKYKVNVKK